MANPFTRLPKEITLLLAGKLNLETLLVLRRVDAFFRYLLKKDCEARISRLPATLLSLQNRRSKYSDDPHKQKPTAPLTLLTIGWFTEGAPSFFEPLIESLSWREWAGMLPEVGFESIEIVAEIGVFDGNQARMTVGFALMAAKWVGERRRTEERMKGQIVEGLTDHENYGVSDITPDNRWACYWRRYFPELDDGLRHVGWDRKDLYVEPMWLSESCVVEVGDLDPPTSGFSWSRDLKHASRHSLRKEAVRLTQHIYDVLSAKHAYSK